MLPGSMLNSGQIWPKSANLVADSGRFRANFGRIPAALGRFWARFGRTRAKFARSRANFDRIWAEFGQLWPILGQVWPKSSQFWAIPGATWRKQGSTSGEFRSILRQRRRWTKLVDFRQLLPDSGPRLAETGPTLVDAESGRFRDKFDSGSSRAMSDRCRAKAGRLWSVRLAWRL